MLAREIVLPETEPALEWVLCRAIQKVSPKRKHALVQGSVCTLLSAWAEGRGEVGTGWRFRLAPPGEDVRPFVPDIAYLSYERMGEAGDEELDAPLIPPNAVVEIRAPEEQQAHLDHKIAVYLAAGVDVVLIVDPHLRTIIAHSRGKRREYMVGGTFTHPMLPGFTPAVSALFAVLERPRPRSEPPE